MKNILILFFILNNFFSINAQNLVLETNNGTINNYSLTDIQKITFSSLDVLTQLTNGTIEVAPYTDVKHLYFSSTVGTQAQKPSQTIITDFIMSPNPANESLNISFFTQKPGIVLIDIYDLQGKVVLSTKHTIFLNGKQSFTLILNNNYGKTISNGYYIIKFTNNGKSSIKPLVIANS